MAENKTKATAASVAAHLAAIADETRRKDCEALAQLMARATHEPPRMWGPSIVGFGSYHYRYESGREGDSCLVGFASRKGDISVYLMGSFPEREALLAKLGRHKVAKACLYIRRLGDVDLAVLEQLVARSAASAKDRYGTGGG
ncbi:MAG: DUF1801 domain-containing protein [Holophagaceae bacterium]|nr:DUF1801 domain-containing protein [Holophagaceae bacterium]